MTTARCRLLSALGILLVAFVCPHFAAAQAPVITTQPENLSVSSGANVTLSVAASGAEPLAYRWQMFGTNLPGRTNATLALTNVSLGQGGVYSAAVSNSSGVVTSELALLNVDAHLTFRILQLQTNGAIAFESEPVTGDDKGGLVAGRNFVFLTGDNSTAQFRASDLGGAIALGRIYDGMCSDLRTEKIYLLGDGTNIVPWGGGNITSLLELDEETGLPNGRQIDLSTNISMGGGAIFSGYGRVVLWNGFNVWDVALPSGQVTARGTLSLSISGTESWVSWGLAEYFGNALYVVYPQSSTYPRRNIVRSRVGPGSTPIVVSSFTNLADLASFSFSPSRSRWYFHYEGSGQFLNADETIGSAKALFTTNGAAPFLYRVPLSQTNYPGSNVTLSVVAAGPGPFTYQWRFNDNPISGATNSSLVLSNLDFPMTGNYSVEVANDLGAVTSGDAFVYVISVPQILAEPQTRSVLAGASATFTVLAQAAPPFTYQWTFNGAPLPDGTNATHVISSVTASNVGDYRVTISNRFGMATSAVARLVLIVESAFSFRILSMSNDAVWRDHFNITGDDRGGLVVSSNRVIVGGDTAPGIFSADDLSGGAPSPTFYDALVADLRTEKIYSLGDRTNLFRTTTSTVVTTFIEINGSTGVRTTNIINLTQPIPMTTSGDAGLFSGYGQVVIHSGTRVFSVALPSGVVADLGAMPVPQHQYTETWAYWGLAENFGGSVYLVYVQNNTTIARARVPDGLVTSIANFLNLSDMASIGASVQRARWYFHHEGTSQFGGSNQTVGFCSAAFSVTPNQVVDHFTWEPIASQFAGVPFAATISARTLLGDVVSNFTGSVAFAALAEADGSPVALSPSASGSFTNGVWTGELVIPDAADSVYVRATDLAARFGASSPFAVVNANDLVLHATASTNSATQYKALTYHLLVTNSGPESATAVFATNVLPADIDLASVTASIGTCDVNAGTVVCDLGTLTSGQSAAIDLTVVPRVPGSLTNITRIVRGEPEAHPENNAATNIITATVPRILVEDVSTREGSSGADRGTNVFTVQLNTTSALPVSVRFTTAPATATNVGDYLTRSGLIVFEPGVTETNTRVPISADTIYENDEFFYLNLFNVTNAVLVRTQAVGAIVNDDSQPNLVVTNAFFTEGNSGTPLFSFPVRLSAPAGVLITMNWATSNGTAVAGSDFQSASGVLQYTNGSTNLFISLRLIGDTFGESNEFFYVRFFNGSNILVNTQILVVINNDDPANVLHHFTWDTIAPTQELNVPFNVSITAKDVADRTLTSYNSSVRLSSGSAAGGREQIIGDLIPLDNFTGGPYTIGFAFTPARDIYVTHVRHISGTKVSIWRDDGTLVVAQNVNSVNGTWLETPLPAPVRLTAGTTYRLGGFNGNANNPWYYGGTLPPTFADGTVGNAYYQADDAFPTIDLGNSLYCVDLSYTLSLFAFAMTPTNINFVNGAWSEPVTVLAPGDDFRLFATDPNTQVSSASNPFDVLLVDDLALAITPSANPTPNNESLVYSITVSNAGPTTSTAVFMTNQLPANATFLGVTSDRGTVSEAAGQIVADIGTLTNGEVATIAVAVFPNGADALTNSAVAVRAEPEPFVGNNVLTNVVTATGLGLSIDDVTVVEGNAGSTNVVFAVSLTAASTQTVSVAFSTQPSTATAGADYVATNGVLVFPPGTTRLTVPVTVLADALNEANEIFIVTLTQPTNALVLQTPGRATIVNDDPLPMLTVSDVTVQEGRSGLTPVNFTVALTTPSGRTVSFNAATLDGSAVAGEDLLGTNRSISLPQGQTATQLTVFVTGDRVVEPDEFFQLRLSGAANATFAEAEARATILNDDGGGAGVLDYFEWSAVPSPQTIGRGFNVTITARDGIDDVFPFNGAVALAALAGTNAVELFPTNAGPFLNGVWSGALTLSNATTNVILIADDGAGHAGASEPFDVTVADLALSVSAPPQVLMGSPFNYSLVVSNFGPNAATAIAVTNRLPADVVFRSASSSGGACAFANGVVACDVGTLAPGQIGLVTITLVPLRGGPLTNEFAVAAFEFDPAGTNNTVASVVEITGDEDHDALPDAWESQNGLSSADPSDAQLDLDRDGHTSFQEYIAGTDPRDAASVLKAAVSVNASTVQIRFVTAPDKRYVVESAPAPSGPWTPLAGELTGDGDVAVVFDPEPASDEQRFYRVQVRR